MKEVAAAIPTERDATFVFAGQDLFDYAEKDRAAAEESYADPVSVGRSVECYGKALAS